MENVRLCNYELRWSLIITLCEVLRDKFTRSSASLDCCITFVECFLHFCLAVRMQCCTVVSCANVTSRSLS